MSKAKHTEVIKDSAVFMLSQGFPNRNRQLLAAADSYDELLAAVEAAKQLPRITIEREHTLVGSTERQRLMYEYEAIMKQIRTALANAKGENNG